MTTKKDFFTGGLGSARVWTVWVKDDKTDAKELDEMEIRDEAGDLISFHFRTKGPIKFGDGCWNQHVGKGVYQSGSITAEVTNNLSCLPAPKGNTLEIHEDTDNKKAGKDRIWCEVKLRKEDAARQAGPSLRIDENLGQFGAEDDT